MNTVNLFSSSYLAPIEYYFYLNKSNVAMIDIYENFVKQSYRNRCRILSPNGIQNLTIPLVKARKRKLTKNVKISYDENWRKMHWKSLEAAYRSSPYFEFYEDEFHPFYHGEKYNYLIDLNWDLEQKIIQLLDSKTTTEKTHQYIEQEDTNEDYRNVLSPQKHNNRLFFNEYTQVFGDRNGFKSNMSIVDLLFNEGPNALNYLSTIQENSMR